MRQANIEPVADIAAAAGCSIQFARVSTVDFTLFSQVSFTTLAKHSF
jgi:hypothetical protein